MLPRLLLRRLGQLAALSCLPCSLFAPACTQNHDLLGADPPAQASSSASGGAHGGGGAGEGGAGGGVVEPAGPTKLTIVNGVNDYDAIKICFVAYPDGNGAGVAPWPSGAAGLGFARAQVVDAVASVVPPGSGVRLYAIAGDLGATAGRDCAALLGLAAGGAGSIVAAALPVLPASVFKEQRSLLLAATGCLGGAGHSGAADKQACGDGYAADAPNAGLVAVGMSRLTTPGKVALQVVHASAATPAIDVRVTPGFTTANAALVAPSLSLGAIGPFPPFARLSVAEYGVWNKVKVQTFAAGQETPTSTVAMSDVLGHSDLAPTELANGKGVVLVAVGAAPGQQAGAFWHALTYALVKADP